MDQFTDWKARTPFDKKLVLGIMHRKGHKNFEAREEEVDDNQSKSSEQQDSDDVSMMDSNRNVSGRLMGHGVNSPIMINRT